MNWDQIEGNWTQFKGAAQEKWGKLTNDHMDVIAGKHDQLLGKVQEAYGITKEEAIKQVEEFSSSLKTLVKDDKFDTKNSNLK